MQLDTQITHTETDVASQNQVHVQQNVQREMFIELEKCFMLMDMQVTLMESGAQTEMAAASTDEVCHQFSYMKVVCGV